VKAMGKTKVLVKVQPEGKYSELYSFDTALVSCHVFAFIVMMVNRWLVEWTLADAVYSR
jgi:hypothetical protein